LLAFVLSNCTWEDGEVVATFHQPFDLLTEETTIAARASAAIQAKSAKKEIWLPFLNTYRTMCIAPESGFRRLLQDVRSFDTAAKRTFVITTANYCFEPFLDLRAERSLDGKGRTWSLAAPVLEVSPAD
jgi:hypothetical protein